LCKESFPKDAPEYKYMAEALDMTSGKTSILVSLTISPRITINFSLINMITLIGKIMKTKMNYRYGRIPESR